LMSVLEPEPAPEAGLESLLAYAERAAARQAAETTARTWWRWLVPAFSAGGLALALVFVLSTRQTPQSLVVPAPPEQQAAEGAAAASPAPRSEERKVALAAVEPARVPPPQQGGGAVAEARFGAPLAAAVSTERDERLGSRQGASFKRKRADLPRAQAPERKERARLEVDDGAGAAPPAGVALALEAERAAVADSDAPEPTRRAQVGRESSQRREAEGEAVAGQLAPRPAAPAANWDSLAGSLSATPAEPKAAEKKAVAKAEQAAPAASGAGRSPDGRFDAQMKAAARLSSRGDHARAARLLEQLLAKVAPDDERAPAALLLLARELELAGEAAAAERAYSRFLSLFPAHPSAQVAQTGRARARAALEAADGQSAGRGAGWPAVAPAAVHRNAVAPAKSLEEAQVPAEQR
ncbi:MAG: hypothetical protein ACOX6T_25025, partial [Myxococcales bacterium]